MRGLGRVYRPFNDLALRWTASPIVQAKMADGTSMKVDLRSSTEMDSFFTGRYDADLIASVCELLDVDACFLDIGANVGFYSVAVGNRIRLRGGTGKVIAFEPLANNYQRLGENISLNGLEAYCETHNFGLSDKPSEAVITLREDFQHGACTGNASIAINEDFDGTFVKVPIRLETLDGFLSNVSNAGEIDFIKMDIEGHEDFCLRGGTHTLSANRPTILMEVNKPYYRLRNVSVDSAFAQLLPPGYQTFHQQGRSWERIQSLDECDELDNVFFVPNEKVAGKYAKFREQASARRAGR